MPRADRSADRSSVIAFIAFAAAAAGWISVMAVQPKPASLQASEIVITKDIAVVQPPPQCTELAGLVR